MATNTNTKGFHSVFSGADTYKYNGSVQKSCVVFGITNWKDGKQQTNSDGNKNFFRGLCAQGLQAQAGQQPQLIYELGTENYYEIASKPSGSGTLQNVFGPTDAALKSLKQLADLCYETKLAVGFKNCGGDCDKKADDKIKQALVFSGGFLTSVSLSANSQSFLLNGSWTFTFQDLQEKNT